MIAEASKSLEHLDDNLWCMDEKEDIHGDQDGWNISNETSATGRKRRKLAAEDLQGDLPRYNDQHNHARFKGANFLKSTATQTFSTFPHQRTGGFTSAAAQLHDISEAGYDIRQPIPFSGRSRLLFGKRGVLHGDENAAKAIPGPLTTLELFKSTSERKGFHDANQMDEGRVTRNSETRKPPAMLSSTYESTDFFNSRTSLTAIPPELANHKLHTAPRKTRPRPIENEHTSKPYVFLSSSPPPFTGSDPHKTNLATDSDAAPSRKVSSTEGVSEVGISSGKNRPASTCHQTSMGQANQRVTKTLGIRRSMTGWTCRGNQKFSVPNKPRQ